MAGKIVATAFKLVPAEPHELLPYSAFDFAALDKEARDREEALIFGWKKVTHVLFMCALWLVVSDMILGKYSAGIFPSVITILPLAMQLWSSITFLRTFQSFKGVDKGKEAGDASMTKVTIRSIQGLNVVIDASILLRVGKQFAELAVLPLKCQVGDSAPAGLLSACSKAFSVQATFGVTTFIAVSLMQREILRRMETFWTPMARAAHKAVKSKSN